MRIRSGFVILAVIGVLPLALTGCGERIEPLPTGPQTITGVLERADLSLTRRGTHVLTRGGERVYYVESAAVNLHPLEGRQVELQGVLEHNSDPKDLPVLVVSKVLAGATEERRAWTIPSLGLTFDVPRSWNGAIAKSIAQFTVSGSTVPVLRVLVENAAALPFDFRNLTASGETLRLRPAVIGTRKAVTVETVGQTLYSVYIDIDPTSPADDQLLAFVFRLDPDENVQLQQEAFLSIARTLRFKPASVATEPATGTGASADGKPCGGPAGVLCPTGYSCQVTDAATDIGVCRRI